MVNSRIINKSMFFEIILYILLFIFYKYPLSTIYSYSGFTSYNYHFTKLFISIVCVLSLILAGKMVKNDVYYFIYHIFFVMGVLPGYVMYVFSNISIIPCVLISIPLWMLWIVDVLNIYIKIKIQPILLNKQLIFILVGLLFAVMLPFFGNISLINFNNLLFKDVYVTRFVNREIKNPLIGYLMSPLSRYVLPFLAVYALINKKKILFIFTVLCVLFIYLTSGALKGLLFSYASVIFFYKYLTIKEKTYKFLKYLNLVLAIDLIYFFITKQELFTTYLRRLLFVSVYLFDNYYKYFNDNYTYYGHTRIGSILGANPELRGITLWFGENILGKEGLNASVGTFVEGYISLGVIGVFFASLFFILFSIFYRGLNIDNRYIGLLFVCTGLFRGAMFGPLLLTHGLVLYIAMLVILIPRRKQITPLNCIRK